MRTSLPLLASVLGLAAVLAAGTARAQPAPAPAAGDAAPGPSRLDAILARKVLRVGMPGDYRPFGLHDKAADTWEGLDVDLVHDMAQALGVRLELVQTSWGTLMPDLLAGRFDIAAGGISVTLLRQRSAFFSTPILLDGKTPITPCADVAKFGTLAQIDRPGVRVIVNPGGTNEAFDRAHLKQAEIVMFPDNTRIFDALLDGKADLMITDATETMLQHKLHPGLCAVHPEHPFDVSEKAVLLPRDVVLQQWVDQFLHQAQLDGRLREAIGTWLG